MSTISIQERDQALGTAPSHGDLPELTTVDRFALRLGLALILRGRHRAERLDRAEQARRSTAGARAEVSRTSTFEHRRQAGPTW